jgi:hypothetical protein
MKLTTAIILAFIISDVAFADQSGYRLFSPEGNVGTTPNQVIATVSMEDLLRAPPPVDKENLIQILSRMLTKAQQIFREAPASDSTNVQRTDIAVDKKSQLQALVNELVGKPVNASFVIIDVVNRPAPVPPVPLRPNAGPAEQEQFDEASKQYAAEKEIFDQTRMLAIGKINLPDFDIELSPQDREAIAAANEKATAEIQRINDKVNASSSTKETAIRHVQDALRQQLLKIRKNAETKRPVQMVYLMGSDDVLTVWKRGQIRNAICYIQKAAIFPYNVSPDLSSTCPGSELVLKVVSNAGAEATTNPAELTQESNEGRASPAPAP